MQRRDFTKNILFWLGTLLLKPFNVLKGQTAPASLLTLERFGQSKSRIPLKNFNGHPYLRLVDFAEAGGFGTFTNAQRRKTVLSIDGLRIKFTANNPFVVINDRVLQILFEPQWQNQELWVSVDELIEIINEFTHFQLLFDEKNRHLKFKNKDVNITGVDIEHKANGALIKINTTRSFSKDQLKTRFVNGWLYLEIIGGKGDERALSYKLNDSSVIEIRAVQFEQLLSIGFRLKKAPKESEVIFNENLHQIWLTLHETELAEAPEKKDEVNHSIDEELERQKSEWMIDTIVIDPGHGGKDPGALGYYRLKEKDIVLSVGLLLGDYLKRQLPGVKILFTRKRDVFIPLWKRTRFANENNGKLFISLHCNSNRRHSVRGFETYFLSAEKDEKARDVVLKENESIKFETSADQKRYEGVNFVLATLAQNAFIKYSQYLASVVQKSLKKHLVPLGMRDRGVRQGPFWVMVGATMPNILVEMGYISNKNEAKMLRRKSTQSKIALAIADGIVKFKKDFESAL